MLGMLTTRSVSLMCQNFIAGLVIKRQPSEQEELPGPMPAETEGQPIKEEQDAPDVNRKGLKAEAGEPINSTHDAVTSLKAESKVPDETKVSTASQQEELSLRPWASPSTPPSEQLLP